MSTVLFLFSLIPFYFVGVIPTGYLIAKARGVDITRSGSGNVGATNVSRVLGKKAGAATLALDIAKGFVAVIVARLVSDDAAFYSLAGVAAVLGHCFSIPSLLRGGKGVSTSLGVILGLGPLIALAAIVIFAVVFAVSRIVSLSSISAALISPLIALLAGIEIQSFYAMVIIALVIVVRHKDNLRRLSEGNEAKFTFAKPAR